MFYRIKQFIWAVTATMSEEQQEYVKRHLNHDELELFNELRIYEKVHCIKVAQLMEECNSKAKETYIRLGLLHDVGKIKYPLNPLEKSMIVVLDRLTSGKIKKVSNWKIVKCYYYHSQLGYEMLRALNQYDKEFLEVVQKHHTKVTHSNTMLEDLKRCDSKA